MNNEFIIGQYEYETNNINNFFKKNMKLIIIVTIAIVIFTVIGIIVYKIINKPPHYTYSIEQIEPQIAFVGKESSININLIGDTKNEKNLLTEAYLIDTDIIELTDSYFYGKSGTILYTPTSTGTATIQVLARVYDDEGVSGIDVAEIDIPITVY